MLDLNPETVAAHAGTKPDPATGALSPPIHLATTFERAADGSYPHGYVYARDAAPTRTLFEQEMAKLEGGDACCAFASGMAAAAAILQALDPGDRVVLPEDLYHGVRSLAANEFVRWGLRIESCALDDPAKARQALASKPKLLWIETPSNPRLRISDIAALVAACPETTVVVDGTWTTPLLQRPLELGADLVLHSVTKYIGGHSDVLGGVVVAADGDHPVFARVRAIQKTVGAVMDPFSAWLALRGLRSLPARLERQCQTALQTARFLARHPSVARVHYPGLPDHPGHEIAVRQMSAFGGMVSFEHAGGETAAIRTAAAVRLFRRATSLGGTESLIEHRASIEPEGSPTPRSLLRLSIGLEHPGDLLADLEAALAASHT